MKTFTVVVSEEAKKDIDELFEFIITEYKSINTAEKYIDGLISTIKGLTNYAEIYQIQKGDYFERFGDIDVRRVNYKKMAVLYTIHSRYVVIRKVMPQSLIFD